MPSATADCKVYLDDVLIPCTRAPLMAGQPTILQPLMITGGRRTRWDQADPGAASFVLHDNRADPSDLMDIVHVGQKVDVFASQPNPAPAPTVEFDQDFETVPAPSGNMDGDFWSPIPRIAHTARINKATDPSFTTTTGKTAGGSATLTVDNTWAQFGTGSIRVTPNGVSNLSAIFPAGGTGMTFFLNDLTYVVSVYIRITAVQTGTLNADARKIRLHQSTGGATTIVATSAAAPNTIGVHRLSMQFTVASNVTQCIISVCNGSSVAAQEMWVDGLMVEEFSSISSRAPRVNLYHDGTTTRTGYSFAWNGTANASASTATYLASSTNNIEIYTGGNVGAGTRSAMLDGSSRKVSFLITDERWGRPWFRTKQPIPPGVTWNFSFMIRLPVDTYAQVRVRGQIGTGDTAEESTDEWDTITVSGQYSAAAGLLVEAAAAGAWKTVTGTLSHNSPVELWPVLEVEIYPETQDSGTDRPGLDNITFTAPAQADEIVQVFGGRVTSVEVEPSARGSINLAVGCTGETADVAGIRVGDEPWGSETVNARLDNIIDAIPATTGFTVSRDSIWPYTLQPRDVDAQPALDLIRQYAGMVLGAVWPISIPGARNHAWIEDTLDRGSLTWDGAEGEISACSIDAAGIRVTQDTDNALSVFQVTWLESDIDPETGGTIYLEQIYRLIGDTDAFGWRVFDLITEFSSSLAAAEIADLVEDVAVLNRWSVTGFYFDTRIGEPSADAQALLMQLLNGAVRPGMLITVTDLPEWFPVDIAAGYVEGWGIQYVEGRWIVDLTMSAAGGGS